MLLERGEGKFFIRKIFYKNNKEKFILKKKKKNNLDHKSGKFVCKGPDSIFGFVNDGISAVATQGFSCSI